LKEKYEGNEWVAKNPLSRVPPPKPFTTFTFLDENPSKKLAKLFFFSLETALK
jgi:hypothetical protein